MSKNLDYLPTYIPTHPPTYLPTHLPTYLPRAALDKGDVSLTHIERSPFVYFVQTFTRSDFLTPKLPISTSRGCCCCCKGSVCWCVIQNFNKRR